MQRQKDPVSFEKGARNEGPDVGNAFCIRAKNLLARKGYIPVRALKLSEQRQEDDCGVEKLGKVASGLRFEGHGVFLITSLLRSQFRQLRNRWNERVQVECLLSIAFWHMS